MLTLLVSVPPFFPTASTAQAPSFEEQVSVAWVLVPVVVRGPGGYVSGLTRDDFRLSIRGEPVEIASFDSELDSPVSLVWLQDLSGSMGNGGKLEASRAAFDYFVQRMRPGDGFAVATFGNGRLSVDVPFTDNQAALQEAMDLWEGYGVTTLYDAVAWTPEISTEGKNHKRAVVLITDGADNASTLDPAVARLTVRDARLPVYVLGLGAGDPNDRTVPDEDTYRYAHLLELLARASGGRFHRVETFDTPVDAVTVAASVYDQIRHQYVLGFPARADGPSRYQRIEVTVEGHPKAQVLHRHGYRGGPPVAAPIP